jgi:uncharacterized OB-fold protein
METTCPQCGQADVPCERKDCPNSFSRPMPSGEFVGGPLDGLRFTPEQDDG